MVERGDPVRSDPPQIVPLFGAVIEENRHPWVSADVLEALEAAGRLRLVVDCGHDLIADDGMDNRNEMRSTIRADRGEYCKPCARRSLSQGGQGFLNSRRRILPEADFGIASMNSTSRIRL